ncbi:MAG: winged helix-turn-helix transcriptional regulator [Thermoplasmata archaeon]|nr:MAG: winged helix-turn-helix transcriptional regulator [Thermoplasmata archaeon]
MGNDETESVLDNETRRLIYNHIMANPGVSFNVLKNVFNMNDSTLRYHLNYLEKNDKISFGLEKRKRNYYPHANKAYAVQNQGNSNSPDVLDLTPRQERIVETIKDFPGITQKELINKTGISRNTINKNLNKLMEHCIVRKYPNGNSVSYEYIENEQLRYEILRQLLIKLINKEIDEKTFLELKRKLD